MPPFGTPRKTKKIGGDSLFRVNLFVVNEQVAGGVDIVSVTKIPL
jgi:hypothetical protein